MVNRESKIILPTSLSSDADTEEFHQKLIDELQRDYPPNFKELYSGGLCKIYKPNLLKPNNNDK